jgi:VanZ family protein
VTARPTTLRRIVVWSPLVAYLGLIFYLSSRSSVGWAVSYPDKLLHFLEYGGLALLLARALNGGIRKPIPASRLVLAGALALIYAVSDEFHQAFVPERTSDWRDVVADAVGAATALAIVALLARHFFSGGASGAARQAPPPRPLDDLARKEPT